MQPIFPRALRPGDTIALVVPASPVTRESMERAIGRFEQRGFRLKVYGDLYREHGYLAGKDAVRAKELMAAFTDPEVAAVFPARGGTGVSRLLDLLDYDLIRQHPKIFAGFSDITALHLALQRKTGLVTFHSPHPKDGPGALDGMSQLTGQTYWRAFLESEYSNEVGYEVTLTDQERDSLETIRPGTAQGRLVGGNLALIASLMGTPYEIETKNSILLLEDINEQPYRIDRCLSQLKLAGKLDLLAGVLLGQLTHCEAPPGKASLTLAEIFDDYFGDLGIPVLGNYPIGHCHDNVTLPLNVKIEMNAGKRVVRILENPVRIDPS